MATMRAALLDQELGFTIHVLESAQSQSNLPASEGQDEGQESPGDNQTMAAVSADQLAEGVVVHQGVAIDVGKPGAFVLGA
jgi:hypothetical protein